jgi:redox-sensitive bicupin YhaK (pirin superfamily)
VDGEVVRAASRGSTRGEGLDSRHSFAFGSAYDPDNTHFGLLLACNEDRLADGAGFAEHPHRDVEVLTWVVSGVLRHRDDAGHTGEARPALMQRMSAGGGVRHSEHAVGGPAHYVQMWVRPATFGGPPAYDTVPVGPGLTEVSPLRQPDATLVAGRLPAGGTAILAPAAYLHLLVVDGTLDVAGVALGPGDALRVAGAGPTAVGTGTGAELLAWRMRSGLSVG